MANNYDDYGYEGDNNSGLFKKILIVVMVIIAILIIIFLIKSCGNGSGGGDNTFDYESALLNAGKNYYEGNKSEYPNQIGECTKVELKTLIEKGLIDKDKFDGCNNVETYLRVCMLENGNKQYTPWINCPNKKSDEEYAPSKEGTVSDLRINESYVEFKFLPEVLKTEESNLGPEETLWKDEIKYDKYKTLSSTTYYRYRDKLYKWDVTTKLYYTPNGDQTDASKVKEYYTVAPNSNYKLYDNKTTEAYKWYTVSGEKEYALDANGKKRLNHVAIDDYIYNEGGVSVPVYSEGTATGVKPTLYYMCSTENNKNSRYVKYTTKKCGTSDDKYIYEIGTIYSCTTKDGDSIEGNKVASATSKCYTWSSWSATNTCDPSADNCKKSSIMLYYWYKYKNGGVKTYYPSKSTSASSEKVYYTSAPIEGAQKDTSTKATAYKWYKTSTKTTTDYTATKPTGYASVSKTDEYKWGAWTDWSTTNPKTNDGRDRSIETKTKIKLRPVLGTGEGGWEPLAGNTLYLTEEEMLNLFKNNNYNINTLDDIANDGSVRYQVKMYIRNKKESK